MKSLQVVTPHLECIYNCQFCIAKSHIHLNSFENNYERNYNLWKNNLISTIIENKDLRYVVITGTNEPMQSKECVKDIINILRSLNKDIQIEIQTRYYKQDEIYDLVDVVAYSISNPKLINIIRPKGKVQRYVFVLTNDFNGFRLEDILKFIPSCVSQLTFKALQDSNGENLAFDDYIKNHRIDNLTLNNLKKDIDNYNGNLLIRLDLNCMDSKGRYKIFREDGNLYESWDSYEKSSEEAYRKK